jgi:hypothetical protein
MVSRRTAAAWLAWTLVVGVLYNSCAGHAETMQLVWELEHGDVRPSPATALRVLRAYGNDDFDVIHYLAYADATLGRPYQRYHVRPLADWRKGQDDPSLAEAPREPTPRALVPYRDFLVEYPPGFFLAALPPALVTATPDSYALLFSLEMGLCLTVALLAARRLLRRWPAPPGAPDGQLVLWAAACALALGTIIVRRYDALVSITLCVSLWATVARRPLLAGASLGVAAAAKLLPVVVWPVVALYLWREGRRRELARLTAAAAVAGAVIVGPALALAGGALADSLTYHSARPLELESTAGGLLSLLDGLAPDWVADDYSFGSSNVVGPAAAVPLALATVLPLLGVVAVLALTWRALRRSADDDAPGRERLLVVGSLAALVVIFVTGKVFSPQYLTWLLPLGLAASLAQPDRARWLLFSAFALTQVIFPIAYNVLQLAHAEPPLGALVVARNGLLALWVCRLARGRLHLSSTSYK